MMLQNVALTTHGASANGAAGDNAGSLTLIGGSVSTTEDSASTFFAVGLQGR